MRVLTCTPCPPPVGLDRDGSQLKIVEYFRRPENACRRSPVETFRALMGGGGRATGVYDRIKIIVKQQGAEGGCSSSMYVFIRIGVHVLQEINSGQSV